MAKEKQQQIIYISILSVLVGLLVMFGVRANAIPSANPNLNRREELLAAIATLEEDIAALEAERAEINEQINAIHAQEAESETRISYLSRSLESVYQAAALTELTGPGLTITIDDNREGANRAQSVSPETYKPENYIVHDKDLLYTLSILGPLTEGMAINNVRLTDNYTIRCVGTVIMINNVIMVPPFEIKLIGDPDQLIEAFQSSSRYIYIVYRQLPVRITASNDVLLPAYSGAYTLNHSRPLREETATTEEN